MTYTDKNRKEDFKYYVKYFDILFKRYGHKYVAIRNSKILGAFDSVDITIKKLSKKYPVGTYIIQECSDDRSVYTTSITGFSII